MELWSWRSRPKLVVSMLIPLPPFAVRTGITARVLATIRLQTHFAIWLSYGLFHFSHLRLGLNLSSHLR